MLKCKNEFSRRVDSESDCGCFRIRLCACVNPGLIRPRVKNPNFSTLFLIIAPYKVKEAGGLSKFVRLLLLQSVLFIELLYNFGYCLSTGRGTGELPNCKLQQGSKSESRSRQFMIEWTNLDFELWPDMQMPSVLSAQWQSIWHCQAVE